MYLLLPDYAEPGNVWLRAKILLDKLVGDFNCLEVMHSSHIITEQITKILRWPNVPVPLSTSASLKSVSSLMTIQLMLETTFCVQTLPTNVSVPAEDVALVMLPFLECFHGLLRNYRHKNRNYFNLHFICLQMATINWNVNWRIMPVFMKWVHDSGILRHDYMTQFATFQHQIEIINDRHLNTWKVLMFSWTVFMISAPASWFHDRNCHFSYQK